MKKIILLASMMLATVCAQAQLTVASTGYATTNNITATGKTGIGHTGVLTVTTNIADASHNSLNCGPKSIICAKGNVTTSDSLCKTNITRLASPLQKLRGLRGISFHYKNMSESNNEIQTFSLNAEEESIYLPEGVTPEITTQMRKPLKP